MTTFAAPEIAGLVNDAVYRFEHQPSGLPSEPTVGSRQNVMLAALTLCLLEAAERAGVERGVLSPHHPCGCLGWRDA